MFIQRRHFLSDKLVSGDQLKSWGSRENVSNRQMFKISYILKIDNFKTILKIIEDIYNLINNIFNLSNTNTNE